MTRSVGDALSLVWESDRSWSAARWGGEPLEWRGGIFMLDCRLHNVGALTRDRLVYKLMTGKFKLTVMMRMKLFG